MTIFRVYHNKKHVATYLRRELAEAAIAGWLREWDGGFDVVEKRLKCRVDDSGVEENSEEERCRNTRR